MSRRDSNLVTLDDYAFLTRLPLDEEIKNTIFVSWEISLWFVSCTIYNWLGFVFAVRIKMPGAVLKLKTKVLDEGN